MNEIDFNPRATYVARPLIWLAMICCLTFQSTRHLRGATGIANKCSDFPVISIHAPLTWRDRYLFIFLARRFRFQSTRHLRGATSSILLGQWNNANFNPRATYVARRGTEPLAEYLNNFNPRATYVARPLAILLPFLPLTFQSTRHLRGATGSSYGEGYGYGISIHAPLTWRDPTFPFMGLKTKFQSTRHLRGATDEFADEKKLVHISIHAPLTWRDCDLEYYRKGDYYFNPRATYVARLQFCTITVHNYIFKLVESSNFSFHLS